MNIAVELPDLEPILKQNVAGQNGRSRRPNVVSLNLSRDYTTVLNSCVIDCRIIDSLSALAVANLATAVGVATQAFGPIS